MTKEEAEKLKRKIDNGYHDRNDYPRYTIDPITDRNRYREYIFRIIDENAS